MIPAVRILSVLFDLLRRDADKAAILATLRVPFPVLEFRFRWIAVSVIAA